MDVIKLIESENTCITKVARKGNSILYSGHDQILCIFCYFSFQFKVFLIHSLRNKLRMVQFRRIIEINLFLNWRKDASFQTLVRSPYRL